MQRILVTGAAGFIGSYVTDILIQKQFQVFAVENHLNGFLKNLYPKSNFSKIGLDNFY